MQTSNDKGGMKKDRIRFREPGFDRLLSPRLFKAIGDPDRIAKEHDILFLVDAAQTTGAYPLIWMR